MAPHRLLIHSAAQIVQVVNTGARVVTGDAMGRLAVMEARGDEGLSVVVDSHGLIAAVGYDTEVRASTADWTFDTVIDAAGKSVTPGLVDGHTHSVWAGDRVHEFAMKLAGASYMEVHAAGGGIHYTVEHTRRASEDELYYSLTERLGRMLKSGSTLVECKSGYGLDAETEIKMLRVMERASSDPVVHVDLSPTYCGAHAIPKGSTAAAATEDILSHQLPCILGLRAAGELQVDNIDVFCETGVFDLDQTRSIVQAGHAAGLRANIHGEELSCLHSAEMAAEEGVCAVSHLEEVSEEGMSAMAAAGTIAVILPTTAYILRLKPPPVRDMIRTGVAVALGSDFNPNAHCLSMPLVMHLACVTLRMSMPEALVAATINAAASLGRAHSHGSIEVGKQGDLLVLHCSKWEHLVYQLGDAHHVIDAVVKEGRVVAGEGV